MPSGATPNELRPTTLYDPPDSFVVVSDFVLADRSSAPEPPFPYSKKDPPSTKKKEYAKEVSGASDEVTSGAKFYLAE